MPAQRGRADATAPGNSSFGAQGRRCAIPSFLPASPNVPLNLALPLLWPDLDQHNPGSLDEERGFFSKLARSVLRHIRVSSKQELKERLLSAIAYFNDNPVVHAWTYKLEKAA
jgi:hypothetical protein